MTVAGQRLYIVTSPQDVTDIYKNTKTLTFDEYVRDVMASIGVSKDGIEELWKEPENGNRLHKSLVHAGVDFYREQLLPGNQLNSLWPRIHNLIDEDLKWNNLPKSATIKKVNGTLTLSLLGWTRDVLLKAVITAFFGDKLLELEPQFLHYFSTFDDESWKLTYKYPRSVSKRVYAANDKLIAAIETWLKLPNDQRSEAAWLIQKLETEALTSGIDVRDLAAMIDSLVWV